VRVCLAYFSPLGADTISKHLGRLGHEVACCLKDTAEPADESQCCEADAIILRLGGQSPENVDALFDFSRRTSGTPIIVTSPLSSSMSVEQAVECHVHGYLREPLCLKELELMLMRLSERGPGDNTPIGIGWGACGKA